MPPPEAGSAEEQAAYDQAVANWAGEGSPTTMDAWAAAQQDAYNQQMAAWANKVGWALPTVRISSYASCRTTW
jgi:hypothetical protein